MTKLSNILIEKLNIKPEDFIKTKKENDIFEYLNTNINVFDTRHENMVLRVMIQNALKTLFNNFINFFDELEVSNHDEIIAKENVMRIIRKYAKNFPVDLRLRRIYYEMFYNNDIDRKCIILIQDPLETIGWKTLNTNIHSYLNDCVKELIVHLKTMLKSANYTTKMSYFDYLNKCISGEMLTAYFYSHFILSDLNDIFQANTKQDNLEQKNKVINILDNVSYNEITNAKKSQSSVWSVFTMSHGNIDLESNDTELKKVYNDVKLR